MESAIAAAQAAAKPVIVPITPIVAGTAGAAGAEIAAAAGAARAAETALAAETTTAAAALTAEGAAATEAAEGTTTAGAAAGRAAGETAALSKVQNAAAAAAHKLALAQAEVVGAASAVAAAEITETRSAAAVAAAESARNKALQVGNPALIAQTEETFALAVAQQRSALTALEDARAQAVRTRQLTQATRGTIAQTASFAGLRAGTLAASAPFIAATASVIIFAKSLREASDRTEELNKTTVVFGQSAKQIQDFAETTASSLGISEVEALRAAGIFGNLFRSIQIGQRPAAQMSERLVRLASDLASFNNADPTRVLEALRSGLVGQARPLRVYGIFLSQARAQQEALIETGKKNIKALTNEEIVRARYNLILRDSALAQGDFARTADRLANQARTLRANIADLGGQLGGLLVPVVTAAVGAANDLFGAIREGNAAVEDLTHELGQLASIGPIEIPIEIIRKGLGAGDQGPGGPPSLEESLKKALVPATLITGALAVAAAPETGGLSLLAAQAAFLAGGLIATKQVTDAYTAAAKQAEQQSTNFASALRGVGVDTKAAETPLLSVITDIQKMTQSLSAQAFPAEGLKVLLPHLQAVIAVLRTGPPLAQAFADKLQRIELRLQLAANLSPAELRKVLADIQAELDNFFKGHPLNVTADVNVKTKVTLDTRTAAAQFAGPSAALAEARRQQAEGLRALRALLGLSPDASRAEIQAAIDARKFSEGRRKAIERALAEVNNADAVIAAAERDAANKRKAAASAAEQAARDAATAQARATQSFIDGFLGGRETLLRRRLERAGLTETVGDDLRINLGIRRILRARLEAIRDRIRNLHLHGEALRIAQAAIRTLTDQIASLNVTIDEQTARLAEQRSAAKAAAREAAIRHQEALLAIAEAQGNVGAERAALERIIALDTVRINYLKRKRKKTQEEKDELDRLLVDRAQRNQALRELGDQTKDAITAAQRLQQAEFAFLQTMTGFTANLIGNLIPGGLTGGLVGGGSGLGISGTPTAPSNVRPATINTLSPYGGNYPTLPRGMAGPSGGSVLKSARATGAPAPPTAGQGERQIDWLHRIWQELHKLNRDSDHPEAKHQRKVGAAIADTAGNTHGM